MEADAACDEASPNLSVMLAALLTRLPERKTRFLSLISRVDSANKSSSSPGSALFIQKDEIPIDLALIHALEKGLPECSGVALGFDRLVMLAAGASRLEEVMAFPIDRI